MESPEMLSGFFHDWPNAPAPKHHLDILKGSFKVWPVIKEEVSRPLRRRLIESLKPFPYSKQKKECCMPKIFRYDKEKVTRKKAIIPEFEWLTSSHLSQESNTKDFTCNIRVLERGKYSYPYHFHGNAEELFVILKGKGKLRVPDGIFDITSGDIIIFENGKTGAHQVYNDREESLVYLDLRTIHNIDVCEYPDSGKVNILPFKEIYYKGKKADYFDGEGQISEVWSHLLKNNN